MWLPTRLTARASQWLASCSGLCSRPESGLSAGTGQPCRWEPSPDGRSHCGEHRHHLGWERRLDSAGDVAFLESSKARPVLLLRVHVSPNKD